MREIRNICLYCGAANGDDPQFLAAAEAFGQALAGVGAAGRSLDWLDKALDSERPALVFMHIPPKYLSGRFKSQGPKQDYWDKLAEHEQIEIKIRVQGSSAEIEEHHRTRPDHQVEIEGLVVGTPSPSTLPSSLRVGTSLIAVPANTPPQATAQLSEWFTAAMQAPDVQPKLAAQGLFSNVICGKAFGEQMRRQVEEYTTIAREANIQAN